MLTSTAKGMDAGSSPGMTTVLKARNLSCSTSPVHALAATTSRSLHDPTRARPRRSTPRAEPIIAELKERGWTLKHISRHPQALDTSKASAASRPMIASDRTEGERRREPACTTAPSRTARRSTVAGVEVRSSRPPATTLDTSRCSCVGKLVFVGDTISRSVRPRHRGRHPMMWDSRKEAPIAPRRHDTLFAATNTRVANGKFRDHCRSCNCGAEARIAEVEKLSRGGQARSPTTIAQEKRPTVPPRRRSALMKSSAWRREPGRLCRDPHRKDKF